MPRDTREQKALTNAMLKEYGYRWHKIDEEDMDFAGPNAFEREYGRNADVVWELQDPMGITITERQAMVAIMRQHNDPRAVAWLDRNPYTPPREPRPLAWGQLWQECELSRCDNEPVCVNCFRCGYHCDCPSPVQGEQHE